MNEPEIDMEQLVELSGKIGRILATPEDLTPQQQAEQLRALDLPSQADLEELQRTYEQRWQDAQSNLESRLSALRNRTEAMLRDIDRDAADEAPPSPAYGTAPEPADHQPEL